jgi:hypothetical protein
MSAPRLELAVARDGLRSTGFDDCAAIRWKTLHDHAAGRAKATRPHRIAGQSFRLRRTFRERAPEWARAFILAGWNGTRLLPVNSLDRPFFKLLAPTG